MFNSSKIDINQIRDFGQLRCLDTFKKSDKSQIRLISRDSLCSCLSYFLIRIRDEYLYSSYASE